MYTVKWGISEDADSMEEAAKLVWRRYGFATGDFGSATILDVEDTETGDTEYFDMEDPFD